MVRNPVCAEIWQPISFIRQQMLANSFSFLPVKCAEGTWCLVWDLEIAAFLGTDVAERKQRLALSLDATGIQLQPAKRCDLDTPLREVLRIMGEDMRPLLVFRRQQDQQALVGIVTTFDLL
jgi:hypothetical protein